MSQAAAMAEPAAPGSGTGSFRPGRAGAATQATFFLPHAAEPETWGETITAVSRVPIRDNGEILVDPRDLEPRLLVARVHPWSEIARRPWVRERVARMLAAAQRALGDRLRIQVIEGFRPLRLQRELFAGALACLRARHPEWAEARLREAANAWVAAPDITAPPPHATGGAVDVTLADADGRPLEMTGPLGWNETTAPTASLAVSDAARRNRRRLYLALSRAGLTNYPGEWWHWSWGEPGWAVRTGRPVAVYGAAEARFDWQI